MNNCYWKIGAIFACLQLLSACETLSYKEPLEGARAKVRFATTGKEATVLRAYTDENCEKNEQDWMRLRDGPMMNNRPKSLDLPLNNFSANAAKEVYVEAGKQINMLFVGVEAAGGRVYSCGTPFHYTFAENKIYEVKYNWDSGQLQHCCFRNPKSIWSVDS